MQLIIDLVCVLIMFLLRVGAVESFVSFNKLNQKNAFKN